MMYNNLKEQSVTFSTGLITHMTEKISKEDQNLHISAAIAVHTDTLKVDALKDHDEKA